MLRLTLMFAAAAVLAVAQDQTGEWTLSRSDSPGKIHFSMQSASENHSFSNSSDWNVSDLHGLDLSTPGKHDVHFSITRDAGTINAEGFMKDGQGAGLYNFQPNPRYIDEMASIGFTDFRPERQLGFALHDVSLAYAREMKDSGIQGLDANRLIACRIFHVDAAFVEQLRDAGINVEEVNQLIAFRIHKITPEYIESLRAHGLHNLTPDQLIALRIHGIQ